MSLSAYVKLKNESIDDAFERDEGEWFSYRTRTMSELNDFAALAGTEPLWGFLGDPWIPPEQAAESSAKLRAYLATVEPGPAGSLTDEAMCELATELAAFLESAAKEDGYVVA